MTTEIHPSIPHDGRTPELPGISPRPPEPTFREVEVKGHVRRIPTGARTDDPETSKAAARSVNVTRRLRLALWILGAIEAFEDLKADRLPHKVEGLTDEEILEAVARINLKTSPSGLRTGRKEGIDLGLIEVSPFEGTTSTGRKARRFRLTRAGRVEAGAITMEQIR